MRVHVDNARPRETARWGIGEWDSKNVVGFGNAPGKLEYFSISMLKNGYGVCQALLTLTARFSLPFSEYCRPKGAQKLLR